MEYTTKREITGREISFEADAIMISGTDIYRALIMWSGENQEYEA